MHNVRRLFFKELRESISEWQIKIAGAEEILNPNPGHSRDAIDPGIGRANEDIVMTTLA
jgi:hypothetical protein